MQVLSDEDKRVRYDRGEDLDEMGGGGSGDGFNPFGGGGGQQYTFHTMVGSPAGAVAEGFPEAFSSASVKAGQTLLMMSSFCVTLVLCLLKDMC